MNEYFCKTSLSLIHLDISHNNLSYEDCKLISEKSKNNHVILGMHVDGNCMEINCLGFVKKCYFFQKEKKKLWKDELFRICCVVNGGGNWNSF